MMRAVYATVERVMNAADIKASAYVEQEILEALESASAGVDALVSMGDQTRPAFAPWVGSIVFDWPTHNNNDAFRFWLDRFRLHSLTSIASGGSDLTADALPWPTGGPPFTAVEIDTNASSALEIGASGTGQRSLTIAGVWGVVGEDRTRATWTLPDGLDASSTDVTINAPTGVGSIVLAGSERMIVEQRLWADSTQTASALGAQLADQSVTVTDGSAFLPGEEILIDTERMLVRDVSGDVLIVARGQQGTTLTTHALGAPISWRRACVVERGALGTTAATHTAGAAVSLYEVPRTVGALTIAYAIEQRSQEVAGYAANLDHIADRRGSRAGASVMAGGIAALEARLISEFGRIRHRAI